MVYDRCEIKQVQLIVGG